MRPVPRRLAVRLRARLHPDERGFTLLETVIALSIVTIALVSLAFTATNGFKYVGFARERQAADQIADQVMEQVRGLAYSKIQQGLKTEDLASDPYVQSCSGVYRLNLPGTASCTGEKIVTTSGLSAVTPLVPNNGVIGKSQGYPVDYTYRVYVSNNCPAVGTGCTQSTPYRVTVLITWDSPNVTGPAEKIQTQSYFWSPTGCISSSTHPFAAPCQPFFYGQSLMPSGSISATGSISNLTFRSGSLLMWNAESTLQQEQVSQVQGKITPTATTLVDDEACSGTTCSGGATSSRTTAADADPSGATPNYSSTTLSGGPLSTYTSSGGSTSVAVSNTAGDTGASESAVTATATYVCPPTPPAPPAQTDALPCGGSNLSQAGPLSLSAVLNGISGIDVGSDTIASIGAPAVGTYSTTFADRTAVSGQAGNITDTVVRNLGRVNIGGLPANVPAPAGWDQAFVVLTGYSDTVSATAGTSAGPPSATISAGTLKYWNGSGYTSINLTTSGASGRDYSVSSYDKSVTATVSGQPVTVELQSSLFKMASVPTTASTPSGSGTIVRNSVTSTVGSPVFGTFRYLVILNGNRVVDLSMVLDLGTITAKSLYQAQPTAG